MIIPGDEADVFFSYHVGGEVDIGPVGVHSLVGDVLHLPTLHQRDVRPGRHDVDGGDHVSTWPRYTASHDFINIVLVHDRHN